MPEDTGGGIPENIGSDAPNDIGGDILKDIGKDISEDVGKDTPEEIGGDMPEDDGGDIPKDIADDRPDDTGRDGFPRRGSGGRVTPRSPYPSTLPSISFGCQAYASSQQVAQWRLPRFSPFVLFRLDSSFGVGYLIS